MDGSIDRRVNAWRTIVPGIPAGSLDGSIESNVERLVMMAGKIARHLDGSTITHSKNVFVPVSRRCVNECTYCNFTGGIEAGHASLFPLAAVEDLATRARKAGCTEVLLCGGERADTFPDVQAAIKADGVASGSMVDWLLAACERVLHHGMLPHVNVGLLDQGELERLRPVVASAGLMLESTNPDLAVHHRSPGKDPSRRLSMIEAAGRARIPFTSGVLVGIGESINDVVTSLDALASIHERHGHLQEVIIQGLLPGTAHDVDPPDTGYLLACTALARIVLPAGVAVQVPPNLVGLDHLVSFLNAGASDIGGISPLTPDHVNPDAPWPAATEIERVIAASGYALAERLAVHPRFLDPAAGWLSPHVHEVAAGLSASLHGCHRDDRR